MMAPQGSQVDGSPDSANQHRGRGQTAGCEQHLFHGLALPLLADRGEVALEMLLG